ncbi:hypothetical protein GCM10023193_01990 [Planotetraspora kaengkrachanensis]|uniref:Uncharacterized protein n=1 Tax=Planotetraspora kaengkrachanensis TaxID=575193 RepID=A0A8J3LVF2_9ACTN|nr:hypothetical protein Pka01_03600 [Planotetraspora kaengkrachanensis]
MISYYVDLAIGLILAFLLLSLLVSGLNEGIVRLLGIRSKFLWAYLRDTLDGAETGERPSFFIRMLERLLDMLKGLGRRLRAPLMDLLPPSEEGRSRLPATVLGVFAKLPFGADPRPAFSPLPAPSQSPPLAAAPDSVAAAQAVQSDPVPAGAPAGAAPPESAATGQVLPADGTGDGVVTAEIDPADPAHGADQADDEERAPAAQAGESVAGPIAQPEETAAAAAEPSTEAGESVAAAQVAAPGQGKSMAELLHERLQEIDHSRRGKTSIADIPPARFAVALMEIATEHGGVEPLMRDLDQLKSPIYRPLKAVWDKADADMEAFRRGVEEWFDGEMQRLSMLYKRYVRWVVALLSLVVTLVFSMDALEYGKTLLNDNAYRSAVTAFAQSGEEALKPFQDQCAPGQDTYTCVTEVLSTPAFVKIFANAPVSVTMSSGDAGPQWEWHGGGWWDRLSSPGHWPGFLLTLVAVLFGAPFWWDMFRRVTGLKSRVSGAVTKQ